MKGQRRLATFLLSTFLFSTLVAWVVPPVFLNPSKLKKLCLVFTSRRRLKICERIVQLWGNYLNSYLDDFVLPRFTTIPSSTKIFKSRKIESSEIPGNTLGNALFCKSP